MRRGLFAGGGFRNLRSGQTVAIAVFVTGVELDGFNVSPVAVDGGSATLAVTTGSSAMVPRGVVGGLLTFGCEVCTGTWTSPARTGTWWQVSPNAVFWGVGSRDGDTTFTGPGGRWAWTWTGVATPVRINGEHAAVYGAFAPIGDAWTLFSHRAG